VKPEVLNSIYCSVPIFKAEETVTTPRYRWNCRDHGTDPFVIIQWTLAGEGIFEDERGVARAVPPGYAFISIIPEGARYYYPPKGKQPWTFAWINIYGATACEVFRKFRAQFGNLVPLPPQSATAAVFRHLFATLSQKEPNRRQISLECYGLALEWWREASHQTGTTEDSLERAVAFCKEHFREQLNVKQIAHEAGMSREHFSRSFVARFKETPAAYLRRLRLNEAGSFLRETRLPAREVAMRSGFYSVRHMMRTFQRAYGKSPVQFRESPVPAKKKG